MKWLFRLMDRYAPIQIPEHPRMSEVLYASFIATGNLAVAAPIASIALTNAFSHDYIAAAVVFTPALVFTIFAVFWANYVGTLVKVRRASSAVV